MYYEKRPSKKSKKGYTWAVIFYYTDPYGLKKKYKKSGFDTKDEAKAHGLQMQEEINKTGIKPQDKTLYQVWEEWEALKQGTLAPGTMTVYRQVIKSEIPFLNMPVRSITYGTIQTFFKERERYSKNTNNTIRIVLSNLFKHAKKCGYISQNPMNDIEVHGKSQKAPPDPLTYEEILKINDSLETMRFKKQGNLEQYQAVLWIGYYTGLRLSEVLALEKSDIDLVAGTLSVNKRVEYQDGKKKEYITDRLKTKSSRAVVPLCSPLIEYLQKYLLTVEDYLFSVKFRAVEASLKSAAEKAGINDFHAHNLRHTFVSNLVMAGTDPKTAAELARHSDISTTLNIYTQITEDKKREALENTFKRPEKDPKIHIYKI